MDVFISQKISIDSSDISRKLVKSFDSKITPHVNCRILDAAFSESRGYVAVDVEINYEEEECWVYIEPITLYDADTSDLREFVADYISHGWECPIPL